MKIIDISNLDEGELKGYFKEARKISYPKEIEKKVEMIVEDVIKRGDEALVEYTKRFDGFDLSEKAICLNREISQLSRGVKTNFAKALDVSIERVKAFHEHTLIKDWNYIDELGNILGQKYTPIERVGIYIPGGKASYPSSLIMTAVIATIAGVNEIAVISPPSSFRRPSPLSLAAERIEGISDIYRVGGVQGIAALAFGTQSIKKVDKIVGPGNIYVTVAKKLLYGYVDIDMVAGPSEVLIISDGSVDPKYAAIDLLAQAEHDELAKPYCITYNRKDAMVIQKEVEGLLERSRRKEITGKSIKNNGRIWIVKDEKQAVVIANAIAPEHLEIQTENPRALMKKIKNAGAIFMGKYSAEAYGDYVAGPSHVLPTNGTARFFSPLNLMSFIKFSSVVEMSKEGADALCDYASEIAEIEGLYFHRDSLKIRKRGIENGKHKNS